ncbi:hypothetical protein HPB50_009218 [Hyalomma asiaticum]|uniref:Uncharacterized protein n=1 Tax=Hyalomma asiaticum TaxID=266040 RepID=A0ACB7SU16_HYAAI|nr:hypothetical protein HPB50_009218 [Hyalomma asiaticum]
MPDYSSSLLESLSLSSRAAPSSVLSRLFERQHLCPRHYCRRQSLPGIVVDAWQSLPGIHRATSLTDARFIRPDKFGVNREKLAATLADESCRVLLNFRKTARLGPTERLTSQCGSVRLEKCGHGTSSSLERLTLSIRDDVPHLNFPSLRPARSPVF